MGPAAIVCIRNLMAGATLLLWARMRGLTLPRGRELWRTALHGVMVIGVGNAALATAEQWIPTGLASAEAPAAGGSARGRIIIGASGEPRAHRAGNDVFKSCRC
jgi:hypothetical protein